MLNTPLLNPVHALLKPFFITQAAYNPRFTGFPVLRANPAEAKLKSYS